MSNLVSIQAERCLRISEVARRLGVSRASVYRLLPQIEHISFPGSKIRVVTERALAEFRLVGSVAGVKFGSGDNGIDQGGDKVIVGSGSQETVPPVRGVVLLGQGFEVVEYFRLGGSFRNLEGLGQPDTFRDGIKQRFHSIDTDHLKAKPLKKAWKWSNRVVVEVLVVDGVEPGIQINIKKIPYLHYKQAIVVEPMTHALENVREVVDMGTGIM